MKYTDEDVRALIETLEEISEKDGFTLFAECCIDKSCKPELRDGKGIANCTHQSGVARGFSECARIAKEAIALFDGKP